MNKSETIAEISKALAKFRLEVKQPMKDADNPFFKSKYVPLENVVESIDKCAPNHGLSYVQWPVTEEEKIGVSTLLLHSSGEFIEFEPVFMKPEKNTPQGAGSTISYLKRYSLSAVFGITSDQDDDANEASGNNNKQNNSTPQPQNDPLNDKLTVTFSEALQSVGDKAKLYEQLGTNGDAIKKLLNSKKKAEKEKLIKTLEGIAHDNRNAG